MNLGDNIDARRSNNTDVGIRHALRAAIGAIVARLYCYRQLILSRLVDVLRANRCLLCHGRGVHHCICADCSADLPWLESACALCARPLINDAEPCGDCLNEPPPWQQASALFHYSFPIDRLISALKYHGRLVLADYFGQRLADRVDTDELPDIIIPVPIHAKRLRQRGYNQTLLLARVMASRLKRPVSTHQLIRVRDTRMQKTLYAHQRRSNLADAFVWHGQHLSHQHVLLIDDVLTTGATAEAISQCLLEAGAARVDLLVIARTLER